MSLYLLWFSVFISLNLCGCKALINSSFSYVLGSLCNCGFECVHLLQMPDAQPQERKQGCVKSQQEGEWADSQANLRQLCSAAQKVMCHGIFCFEQHKEASTRRGLKGKAKQRPALYRSGASASLFSLQLPSGKLLFWDSSLLVLPCPSGLWKKCWRDLCTTGLFKMSQYRSW